MRATIQTLTAAWLHQWRRIFLIAEIVLVFSSAILLFEDRLFSPGARVWPVSVFIVCAVALFFLLFVSSFFVPHFRLLAIAGWLMALAILVYALL
jgi:hypothetical protein